MWSSYLAELDKFQTNYDTYYGQYADNAVSSEAYDQSNSASQFQQHLLKYVQQYQDKQDGLSIMDDPSAVSTNQINVMNSLSFEESLKKLLLLFLILNLLGYNQHISFITNMLQYFWLFTMCSYF